MVKQTVHCWAEQYISLIKLFRFNHHVNNQLPESYLLSIDFVMRKEMFELFYKHDKKNLGLNIPWLFTPYVVYSYYHLQNFL